MSSPLEKECERSPRVTMTATYGKAKQYRSDMPNNWRVQLRHQGRRMSVDFYGGSLVTDISVADVLSSLILDTDAGEATFEGFCDDFGYDTDSRKAEATWRACEVNARKVRQFLGQSWDRFSGLEH